MLSSAPVAAWSTLRSAVTSHSGQEVAVFSGATAKGAQVLPGSSRLGPWGVVFMSRHFAWGAERGTGVLPVGRAGTAVILSCLHTAPCPRPSPCGDEGMGPGDGL